MSNTVQSIETWVVGRQYGNRQKEIEEMVVGETVLLIRESSNKFDTNAIKVVRQNHNEIGYIKREMAMSLAPKMDNTYKQIEAIVMKVGKMNDDVIGQSSPYLEVLIKFDMPEYKSMEWPQ